MRGTFELQQGSYVLPHCPDITINKIISILKVTGCYQNSFHTLFKVVATGRYICACNPTKQTYGDCMTKA